MHILPSSYLFTWRQFSYIFVDDIYLITCVSVLYIRNKIHQGQRVRELVPVSITFVLTVPDTVSRVAQTERA